MLLDEQLLYPQRVHAPTMKGCYWAKLQYHLLWDGGAGYNNDISDHISSLAPWWYGFMLSFCVATASSLISQELLDLVSSQPTHVQLGFTFIPLRENGWDLIKQVNGEKKWKGNNQNSDSLFCIGNKKYIWYPSSVHLLQHILTLS